ncbi:coproporphyrinogen III oxidase [Cephaloticoccus capnophilus]|uniref:Heme chaperone HemW n=1 Tax=Cephaloticoccus capnophilus TaxID=1548208 RepID=A0A139SHM7_9BACT|nr:radical SAM family heme chaperone HemW [Cephaloticoccus capnophilus]KXU34046.1 coproporphyrinogen III oxidase [Cephaloticoccus capnophilus]
MAAPNRAAPLGLYVHVPFCASTCDFCAFYQVRPTASDIADYFAACEAEAALVKWSRPVTTVFWGGGTPGLLSPDALRRLGEFTLRCCSETECGSGPTEWTVEMAPASVTEARLAALREIGVTRISMGVQSFQAALLAALGRQHSREQIYRAYERIRAAGFSSVNLDLMFALPGQTAAEWEADIAEALALAPDHLSTYCLTFEEDTALWLKLSQGRVKLDPEHEAQLYEQTWARLAAAGYGQYEVANFARPGHACRHNLNTWAMSEWVGLGPAAASQHGGWRGGNVADLRGWAERVQRGERMTEERKEMTPAALAEDAFIFGLRMNAGVSLEEWRTRAPDAPWAAVEALAERLVADELALWSDDRLCLSTRGRLLADAVGLEMMEAFQDASQS